MIARFLNPKNDLIFKRIFGSEQNKDILIHFLNDIFARTTNPIEDVEFIKPIMDPEINELRVSIIDVLCKDLEGNRFIIEMQCAVDTAFIKRAQYYASKVYCSQRIKGISYKNLKSVTFLAILDENAFPEKKDYLSHHIILDKDTHEHDLKDFSFSFLELRKFDKNPEDLKTMIEKWAYFFKHAEETSQEELSVIVGSDGIIEKAYDALSEYNYTVEEMLYYDQLERNEDVNRQLLIDHEAKGRAKGLAEGKAEGEKMKAREVVLKMHRKQLNIKDISEMVDLSIAEVEKIISEN